MDMAEYERLVMAANSDQEPEPVDGEQTWIVTTTYSTTFRNRIRSTDPEAVKRLAERFARGHGSQPLWEPFVDKNGDEQRIKRVRVSVKPEAES